jgi:hypothetical protein
MVSRSSRPLRSRPGKLLNELEVTGTADRLCGLDLIHLAIEGGPAHALGLVDGIANAAVRSETVPALERLTDGAVIGALALRAVGKPGALREAKNVPPAGL